MSPAEKLLRRFGPGLVLFAAVALCFAPALSGQFIWDDDAHLNATVRSATGLWKIWTSASANYFPLTLTNLWLQHLAWGMNPLPYHAFTIALQAFAAVLLWRVLLRLGVPGAWLGALVWAVHPVQVESVAWISELKNTQSCVFFLAATLWFLRWRELSPSRAIDRRYAAALVFGACALLSKTSTVVLPAVLALCCWWRDGKLTRRDAVRLAPFFALSAGAALWTIWEQRVHSGAGGAEWTLTLAQRLLIAAHAFWFYLGKLFTPQAVAFVYPRWNPDPAALAPWFPLLATLVAATALTWLLRRGKARGLGFAAAYFVICLLPVAGFFNVYYFRYSFVADHFQHLASIGPIVAITSALVVQLVRLGHRGARLALAAVLPTGLGVLSARECRTFHANETLWRTTLARNPNAWIAQTIVGNFDARRGDHAAAIKHHEQALRSNPLAFEAHFNLANSLAATSDRRAAIAHYRASLELNPQQFEAHYNLANVLSDAGAPQEALAHYERAVALKGDSTPLRNNYAVALAQAGRLDAAIEQLRAALRIEPTFGEARRNLVIVLRAAGRSAEAQSVEAHEGAAGAHVTTKEDVPNRN